VRRWVVSLLCSSFSLNKCCGGRDRGAEQPQRRPIRADGLDNVFSLDQMPEGDVAIIDRQRDNVHSWPHLCKQTRLTLLILKIRFARLYVLSDRKLNLLVANWATEFGGFFRSRAVGVREIAVLPKIQFAGNRTSTMVAYPPSDESEPRQSVCAGE
jgi:hypothetical protein